MQIYKTFYIRIVYTKERTTSIIDIQFLQIEPHHGLHLSTNANKTFKKEQLSKKKKMRKNFSSQNANKPVKKHVKKKETVCVVSIGALLSEIVKPQRQNCQFNPEKHLMNTP